MSMYSNVWLIVLLCAIIIFIGIVAFIGIIGLIVGLVLILTANKKGGK